MAWASLALSWALSVLLVAGARWVAWRVGVVDRPGGHKAHGRPVPLLGGPAVVLAVVLTVALIQPSDVPWLLPAVALSALGLLDDLRGIGARARLAVELAVTVLLLRFSGTSLWTPPFVPEGLATVLTAVWLVGVVNAANCFDCADGSLAGVGLLAAVGVAGLTGLSGGSGVVPALALAGALAGFWIYNRPPARIFLGDAGSLPVGLLLGWLAVRAASGQPAPYTLAAVLVVSVPVVDFLVVHARRCRRAGWAGLMESTGRDHLPHRFLDGTGSAGRGLGSLYGLQLGGNLAAMAAASAPTLWLGVAVVLVWVAVLLWVSNRLPECSNAKRVPAAADMRPGSAR